MPANAAVNRTGCRKADPATDAVGRVDGVEVGMTATAVVVVVELLLADVVNSVVGTTIEFGILVVVGNAELSTEVLVGAMITELVIVPIIPVVAYEEVETAIPSR